MQICLISTQIRVKKKTEKLILFRKKLFKLKANLRNLLQNC